MCWMQTGKARSPSRRVESCIRCIAVSTVLTTETEIVNSLMEGQKGTIFVEKTPFYATMGGQVGDTGVIETANGKFVVEDTIKLRGGKFGHVGHMESGMISTGETVSLKVNEAARRDTEKNHSEMCIRDRLDILEQIFIWLSLALTVISLITYIWQNRSVLSMQDLSLIHI